MEALDLLANNIANQGAAGYKADREFYDLYISPEAAAGARPGMAPLPTTAPMIERQWTDFSQGTLSPTGNPLHLGLSGRGFFTINGPNGPLYTRNGSFQLSTTGRLETTEGYAVMDKAGKPIQLDATVNVDILAGGEIRQAGEVVAELGLVDFAEPSVLAKQSGSYFHLSDATARPGPAPASVHQGKLEAANSSPAEGAVRLVTVLRQFEMLQRAVAIGGEMSRKAEEVARVGS